MFMSSFLFLQYTGWHKFNGENIFIAAVVQSPFSPEDFRVYGESGELNKNVRQLLH